MKQKLSQDGKKEKRVKLSEGHQLGIRLDEDHLQMLDEIIKRERIETGVDLNISQVIRKVIVKQHATLK